MSRIPLTQGKFALVDDADVPAAVKISKSILMTPLAEHYKATGELLDGVELRPAEDRFYVK